MLFVHIWPSESAKNDQLEDHFFKFPKSSYSYKRTWGTWKSNFSGFWVGKLELLYCVYWGSKQLIKQLVRFSNDFGPIIRIFEKQWKMTIFQSSRFFQFLRVDKNEFCESKRAETWHARCQASEIALCQFSDL